jgi:hypothetical protein
MSEERKKKALAELEKSQQHQAQVEDDIKKDTDKADLA